MKERKKKKKLAILLLSLLMIIAFLPASVWAEDPGEQIVYMSKNGAGMKDGSSADNAKEINKINELSGDVIIKVVGKITLPEVMPE